MSSKSYEIKCRDDIICIPDVATGLKFGRSWGLNLKGLKAKDDIIKVLLSSWDEKNHIEEKKDQNFAEAESTNAETRQTLLQKYEEVKSFHSQMGEVLQNDINSVFPNFIEELERRKSEILVQDCFILVAGDRVSGKSSFINLLLGKDILPTQQLACTATVCEIKYNEHAKVAQLHSKGRKSSRSIDLVVDEKQDFKMLKEHIKELDNDDESPYEKIEIFWPFDILKNGIVLVDTPGIGENRQIIHRLQEYMKQSFGFIYIIDSAQATGLQKGRLTDFLRTVVNSSVDTFDPRATLFVCNKWDVVPVSEQPEIRSLTMSKLKKIYSDVKAEQVFMMSTLQAAKSFSYGSTSPELQFLLKNGVNKLITASLKNKTISQYRWLKMVLQRVCYALKVSQTLGAQSVKTNNETIEKLKVQLERLNNDAEDVLKSARTIVEEQIDLLHKDIADLLRSRNARDKICIWSIADCPRQGDYKKVLQEASEKIADRIAQVIDDWEKENKSVAGLQETIIQKFEEECQLMDNQIQEVAGVLRISRPQEPNDIRSSFSAKVLWGSQGGKNPSEVDGLGSAVSCAGCLSTSDRKIRELFKKYKKDKEPEEKLMQASVYYMESIFVGHRLRESLSKFLKRFIKGIDSIGEKIPDFIKADHELIWQMELDLHESRGALKNVYPALLKKANKLQGQLDLFYVTKCMKYDYSLEDITWNNNNLLGSGSFADVYKAKLIIGQDEVNVALKITNDQNCVRESTVTDILREENTLRSLKHDNIIKFYGSTLFENEVNNKKKVKWIMILEYCYDTLKNKLIGSSYKNPACVSRDIRSQQIKIMAQYVVQLCSGLQCLHDRNLVHRDLKLENVLVTKANDKDIVKLTDVGLTKCEDLISGTFVGSPVYMAPEIILRTGAYDRKADIYSLAIILWEIWYGQDAAVHIGEVLSGQNRTLEKAMELDKLRPSLEIESRPLLEIEDIIEKCWNEDPKKRLDSRDVEQFFQTYQ